MSHIPIFSQQEYLDSQRRLTQKGTVDSDTQKQSPASAGARGLRKFHDFTKAPTQIMKKNYHFEEIRSLINIVDNYQKKN